MPKKNEGPTMVTHPMLPDAFRPEPEGRRPQHVNRASSICHPCTYHGYLSRVAWNERGPWSETLQRIFRIGRKVERETVAAMAERGLDVTRAQETLSWPELQLSGHHDGIFELGQIIDAMERDGTCIPDPVLKSNPHDLTIWDVKSADPNVYGKYLSIEDLLAPLSGASVYRWNYPGQLSLYASHENVKAKWCCIYFVNRSTYQTIQVWWRADHPLAVREIESAHNACKWINWAIAKDIDRDTAAEKLARPGRWCEGCAFRHICERFLLTGDEVHIKTELAELVAKRVTAAKFKSDVEKKFDASNNRLKEVWKKYHAEHGNCEVMCGDVLVKVKADKNGVVSARYK